MADYFASWPQTRGSNPSPQLEINSTDPISLILSPDWASETPPQKVEFERGRRYREYSELREANLKKRFTVEHEKAQTPPAKLMRFPSSRRAVSKVAQSVPDFSSVLRKENRRPSNGHPSTPPARKNAQTYARFGWSKSATSADKKVIRKSSSSIEDLRCMSSAACAAINGENMGGRRGTSVRRNAILKPKPV